MKFLDNRYVKVFNYKDFDICTLKNASPSEGDSIGYVIDDNRFANKEFNLINDAVDAIDAL